jgi:Ion channel
MQLGLNLAAATSMVAITTLTHFFGLILLMRFMSSAHTRLRDHPSRVLQASMIMIAVFGLFALHTAEIWSYAALYRLLGELSSFEEALYFATVTFVSLGYGDVVLTPTWRVLSAIEGANGVILIAWSTAFLLSVTNQLRVLEHNWLERKDR